VSKRRKSDFTIENPRKIGEHVSKTLDYLEGIGASDVRVTCRKHLRFDFSYGGKPLWFMLSSSPKDRAECAQIARQIARRVIRQAGMEARQ
jgi:Uri superfamily endonuclease